MRYLITFSCYGTHLHGDDSGTVDRKGHNRYKSPALPMNPALRHAERQEVDESAYVLDASRRLIVLDAMREVCSHRGWILFAAHARSTHVHAVIEAKCNPERVMNDFKSYASRNLNRTCDPDRKRWARHASTRWLLDDQAVSDAIHYVVELQGVPIAVFNAHVM